VNQPTDLLARAHDVTRDFDSTRALDGVSLDVPAGQIVGLLGPNGAGKTTLLSLLLGLRRPTSGRVELFGGDPRDPASRRSLGSTPQETGLPATLRVGEVVDFVSRPAGSRVGSGAGWPWHSPSSDARGWWCSTSRRRVWTSTPAGRCGTASAPSTRPAARCC
jgi:energy-coupling factor transporter ATP-binding protein EcfA2